LALRPGLNQTLWRKAAGLLARQSVEEIGKT